MQQEKMDGKGEELKNLMMMEDLMGKKAKIYSRLLMDAALAKDMEALSLRHEKRGERLEKLRYGKVIKKRKEGGRDAMSEENV